jgi:hypothetical protein
VDLYKDGPHVDAAQNYATSASDETDSANRRLFQMRDELAIVVAIATDMARALPRIERARIRQSFARYVESPTFRDLSGLLDILGSESD